MFYIFDVDSARVFTVIESHSTTSTSSWRPLASSRSVSAGRESTTGRSLKRDIELCSSYSLYHLVQSPALHTSTKYLDSPRARVIYLR